MIDLYKIGIMFGFSTVNEDMR